MRKEPSPELLAFFAELLDKYDLAPGTSVHVNMPMICDRCLDEEKEAFPYQVEGYPHLCNECWEEVMGFVNGNFGK